MSSQVPIVEIVQPRMLALKSWLLWPAALAVGGVMGLSAFYGAQSFRQDPPVAIAEASTGWGTNKDNIPTASTPDASAYALLLGSTPTPAVEPTVQADIPLEVAATPKTVPTVRPAPKATIKPKSSPSPVAPAPSAKPLPSSSAHPSALPSPLLQVTVYP